MFATIFVAIFFAALVLGLASGMHIPWLSLTKKEDLVDGLTMADKARVESTIHVRPTVRFRPVSLQTFEPEGLVPLERILPEPGLRCLHRTRFARHSLGKMPQVP